MDSVSLEIIELLSNDALQKDSYTVHELDLIICALAAREDFEEAKIVNLVNRLIEMRRKNPQVSNIGCEPLIGARNGDKDVLLLQEFGLSSEDT